MITYDPLWKTMKEKTTIKQKHMKKILMIFALIMGALI